MKLSKFRGASADAIMLTLIKLVTIVLGLTITRLLSEYLSVYDYGTYSQVLLVVSTVTSLTILGMMDGVNYFYCREQDVEKREVYISTIFCLQCIVSAVGGALVLFLTEPLCVYFENPGVRNLLIFAAVLPLLQNLLSMFQVLLVSVGKARLLAVRNLVVSVLRLAAVLLVVLVVQNVAVILLTTVLLDVAQIALFGVILKNNGCRIRMNRIRLGRVGEIFRYCAPMAVFTVVSTLNRDIDKYIVALWTDTQTLAVYTNASKVLPFDIIMTSFTTVLLPSITRLVARKSYEKAAALYRVFLEIAYISTGILCFAALAAAPQLMELLYSQKYAAGLSVFCIYILVDLLRFTNITLILSAAGKTKKLMFLSVGSVAANTVLNVALFPVMGMNGPALATLLVTLGTGVLMLYYGTRELETKLGFFFDGKYLAWFVGSNLAAMLMFMQVQRWLTAAGVHYFVILSVICGCYGILMLILHGKRLLRALKRVNETTDK